MVSEELLRLARSRGDTIWIDSIPWTMKQNRRILTPLGLPHTIQNVNRHCVREALRRNHALIAYWTSDWDRTKSEWWWVCCDDKDYDVKNILSSRGRRGIRKGLRKCTVRLVDGEEFARISYNIYVKALVSYGAKRSHIPERDEYRSAILNPQKYEGIEHWGVFIGKRLVGTATCILLGDAVKLGTTKSDPQYHKYCPNNALFYTITQHYLRERGFGYITNGSRTLWHPTTINEFLMRQGYRRVYCRLNVELSRIAGLLFSSQLAAWGEYVGLEKILRKQWHKIEGLSKLIKISRTF